MSKYFEKNVTGLDGRVRLASTTPEKHMNVILQNSGGGFMGGNTLSKAQALELRDALNEVYPVERTKDLEPPQYTVRSGDAGDEGQWVIEREVPTTRTEFIANADQYEHAVNIVKALNEAEGL